MYVINWWAKKYYVDNAHFNVCRNYYSNSKTSCNLKRKFYEVHGLKYIWFILSGAEKKASGASWLVWIIRAKPNMAAPGRVQLVFVFKRNNCLVDFLVGKKLCSKSLDRVKIGNYAFRNPRWNTPTRWTSAPKCGSDRHESQQLI